MPRLDGLALLRAVRADPGLRELPVILMSAWADEESRVAGLEAGADDYLGKPFSPRELLARVGTRLELARLRREAARRERQLRDEAQAARERLELVLSGIDDAFVMLDRDWRYTYVNDRACQMTGRRREDWLGKTHWELFPETAGSVFEEQVRRAAAGRVPAHFEYWHPPSGRWLEMHAYPSAAGLALLATDVTARKQSEEEVRRGEERLLTALEAARMVAWDWEVATNTVRRSPNAVAVTGLAPEALTGTGDNFFTLVHPEDRERVRRRLREAVEGGAAYDVEFRLVRPDGAVRWMHDRARVLRDAEGRPIRMTGLMWDVTERKLAEQSLREADRRKDEFLAMLAHELRNPLAPLRNALEVLKLPDADPADAARMRAVMERQVEHLVRLVDDLLDVSRIMRGKIALRKEVVELAAVVMRAVETAQPLIEARAHELSVKVDDGAVPLEGDLVRLAQVVSNLLHNAAKYTEPGGRISLEARREGAEVVLCVRDNGVGIPPEVLPHVFDLFVQADRSMARSQGGLGIGLTVVKRLVELHGGRVEARSEGPGRGSEFIVRLPAAEGPKPAPKPRPAPDGQPAARRRALVVDDNADAAESLAVLLRSAGHEVRTAYDGPSALAAARDLRPEVVLLDLGLPGMDGCEVARRLRQLEGLQGALLVALTGYGSEEDRRRSKEAGFDRHLVKPVDPAELRELFAAAPAGGR